MEDENERKNRISRMDEVCFRSLHKISLKNFMFHMLVAYDIECTSCLYKICIIRVIVTMVNSYNFNFCVFETLIFK